MSKISIPKIIKKSERGFTLIEVLVVMVIIGLLVRLVTVNVRSSSESAKNTQIKSLMSQTVASIGRYRMGGGENPMSSQQVVTLLGNIRVVYGSILTNAGDVSASSSGSVYWVKAPLIKNGALGYCFFMNTDGYESTSAYSINCGS